MTVGDLILTFVQNYGGTVVAMVFTALSGVAVRQLMHVTNAIWVKTIVERIFIEAKAAVLEVQQTYVDEMAKARADGVITADEAKAAKARALLTLRSNIGPKGLRRLMRIVGFDDPAIDRWLGTHLEAAVQRLNLAKSGQVPAVPTAQSQSPL